MQSQEWPSIAFASLLVKSQSPIVPTLKGTGSSVQGEQGVETMAAPLSPVCPGKGKEIKKYLLVVTE